MQRWRGAQRSDSDHGGAQALSFPNRRRWRRFEDEPAMGLMLAHWVSEYGCWAVFAGTLVEGETILVLAGIAAQQGLLSLPAVIGVAFGGAFQGDQCFFFVGRWFGGPWIARHAALRRRAERVSTLMRRHHAWVIVGVRFAYGVRTAGPIAIGATGVPMGRFAIFNALGAAIWAPAVAGAGFLSGQSFGWLLPRVSIVEAVGLAVVAICVATCGWMRRKRRGR